MTVSPRLYHSGVTLCLPLDAVVLIRCPNGGVEYGLMRHDSSFDRIDL